jgi:ribosomal protein S18 acetylase RimI-like enzyme
VLKIRRASVDDAHELSVFAARTFRQTFGAANDPERIDQYCRETYNEAAQLQEIASLDSVTLLCEQQSELVGFAQLRWSGAPACVTHHPAAEIQRFYLDGRLHGQGVASSLMRTCFFELAQRGFASAWLGVWEHNPRAIAFYRKHGFAEVGAHSFDLGGDLQRDIVMFKSLDEALRSDSV